MIKLTERLGLVSLGILLASATACSAGVDDDGTEHGPGVVGALTSSGAGAGMQAGAAMRQPAATARRTLILGTS